MKLLYVLTTMVLASVWATEREDWANFKLNHGKVYRTIVEEKQRYVIFQANLKKIQEHDKKYQNGQSSFKMAVNKFADLTAEEFMERMKYQKSSKPSWGMANIYVEVEDDLPAEIDWSKKGAVTEVKDQAACGSCWSFSATGTVESQYFIKTGKLVSLSEQNLVDCAHDDCYGCNGGFMDKALEYIEANGIMLEKDYPYEGIDDVCRFNRTNAAVKISSFTAIKSSSEDDLKKAVALKGPVSVAVAVSMNFQFYDSGILDDKSCGNSQSDLNHGVLATGYGTLKGKDYWIVKNSWGLNWGQKGYLWMSRNADNQCGIATDAVFPVI